ncbi:MAG: hypothetical protein JW808_02490 [Victivallales bacterium]|nr:hypothetical protein [Victivallales bacterium]
MRFSGFFSAGLFSFVLLTGCGSLDQRLGGDRLSKGNIDYALDIIREPDWTEMVMTIDGVDERTDKWNSDVMPAVPVVYWTSLGSFKGDKFFGVRKVASVFPAFYLMRDSVYNAEGVRIEGEAEFNLLFSLWYASRFAPDESCWKFGLLYLPVLGPFLGFGTGYFQFLWIPFSDMD